MPSILVKFNQYDSWKYVLLSWGFALQKAKNKEQKGINKKKEENCVANQPTKQANKNMPFWGSGLKMPIVRSCYSN